MPELPEVHTTAQILNKHIPGKKITGVWSDYESAKYTNKENIKCVAYLEKFKKEVLSQTIQKVSRRAKYILITLSSGATIVIHMKMTGHLLFGTFSYSKKLNRWCANEPGPLQDPFNRFIHFVVSFEDGTHLAFSDMRKFATIYVVLHKKDLAEKLKHIGPEPLESSFTVEVFKNQLLKQPNQNIKTALLDQRLVAGIGNIYSDEILWKSHIHPLRKVSTLTQKEYVLLTKNTKHILSKGISFGGDSLSDYRNPYGLPGEFQLHHNVYRRTGKKCNTSNCSGSIERHVIGGRSAHFCKMCQQ
jgi:formamidopyrimidine-DNA glycosylase